MHQEAMFQIRGKGHLMQGRRQVGPHPLVVADEPTGNLDSVTAETIFQLFAQLVAHGKTILMVTHDDDLAIRAGRAVRVADGQIVEELSSTYGRRTSLQSLVDA